MPKKTEIQKGETKQEIINACEEIYEKQGFYGVTIKEISSRTSITRSAIYTYFETKDEILLALLEREFEVWILDLEKIEFIKTKLSKSQLAEELAHSLENRNVLLRILNMNLYEIELNCRIERLADFKRKYKCAMQCFVNILRNHFCETNDSQYELIFYIFSSFLFGVYPYVFHSEKQIEAMKAADVTPTNMSVFELVYDCLIKILPNN